MLSFNKFSFFFKTKKLPIFLKKKLKKKYVVEPLIIKKKFREKYTLKFLFFFVEKMKDSSLKKRMFSAFSDVFLNYTDSFFYLQKIIAFRKVITFLKK